MACSVAVAVFARRRGMHTSFKIISKLIILALRSIGRGRRRRRRRGMMKDDDVHSNKTFPQEIFRCKV